MKTFEELLEQKIYEETEAFFARDNRIIHPAPIVQNEKGDFGKIGYYIKKKSIKCSNLYNK